jgi:hypothetical protein
MSAVHMSAWLECRFRGFAVPVFGTILVCGGVRGLALTAKALLLQCQQCSWNHDLESRVKSMHICIHR